MALDQVEDVQIEADGVFKYILIELTQREKKGKEPKEKRSKTIVRGFEWAEFHGINIQTSCLYCRSWSYVNIGVLLESYAKYARSVVSWGRDVG